MGKSSWHSIFISLNTTTATSKSLFCLLPKDVVRQVAVAVATRAVTKCCTTILLLQRQKPLPTTKHLIVVTMSVFSTLIFS